LIDDNRKFEINLLFIKNTIPIYFIYNTCDFDINIKSCNKKMESIILFKIEATLMKNIFY